MRTMTLTGQWSTVALPHSNVSVVKCLGAGETPVYSLCPNEHWSEQGDYMFVFGAVSLLPCSADGAG